MRMLQILTKINKVVDSCRTEEQLPMAKNYCYTLSERFFINFGLTEFVDMKIRTRRVEISREECK